MNKKVLVLGVIALLAISGIIASNMGFKLNYRLEAASTGISASGTNTLALPFHPQSNIVTANNLMNDIVLTNVASVSRFLEDTDGLYTYTGRRGSPVDFNLVPGEGYLVKMLLPVDYIVVGSHNPSLAIPMDAAGAGSLSGTNLFATPYHSSVATANGLMLDMGLLNVASVSKFLEDTDGLYTYTGRRGSPVDFALVPGEAYLVKMLNTVSYVPSHY